MYQERRPSITNRLTKDQITAWNYENAALVAKNQGQDIAFQLYRQEALEIRRMDIHNKIQELFNYSDAQDGVIEVGLHLAAEGHEIPIVEFPGVLSGSLKGTGE